MGELMDIRLNEADGAFSDNFIMENWSLCVSDARILLA